MPPTLRRHWPMFVGLAVATSLLALAGVHPGGIVPRRGWAALGMALAALSAGLAGQLWIDSTTSLMRERRRVEAGAALREASSRLEQLAITDAMTGILNRRGLENRLSAEFNRSRRYDRPLSVLMIDIDSFKAINDVLGHAYGDFVLAKVASMLASGVRDSDVAGRYGGEELVVLLPETASDDAVTVAENLRIVVREHAFDRGGDHVEATVSVGVATLVDVEAGADALVELADQAMYQAKRAGKDRVVMAEPSRAS
jgi:diguanylate cyclase (GGDEF)-like protein